MSKFLIIKKENLLKLLEKASKDYDVYLPLEDKTNAIIDFFEISSMDKDHILNLKEKTKKSPKSVYFPSTEEIFSFEYIKDINEPDKTEVKLREKVEEQDEGLRKKILFGLKPCDTHGINLMDLVFGEGDRKDSKYIQKRKGSIIISIGCHLVFPDCFCTSVGGDPFDFNFSDLGLIDMQDYFIVFRKSENIETEKFLNAFKDFFEEKNIDDTTLKEIDATVARSKEKCDLNWEKIDAEKSSSNMDKGFNDERTWKEITNKCISCAACTYVCPTCVCFNIGDELRDLSGERYKCWDFCTNYYYTLEASGHNPRSQVYQRYRNKGNCKYNYFYKRNKNIYCVGCGRCVDICPVGIDIREIVGTFYDK